MPNPASPKTYRIWRAEHIPSSGSPQADRQPSGRLICAAVIRLRAAIERAPERRWIWPLVLVALVVLLAFVGLHVLGDHFESAAAATCGGILLVSILVLGPARLGFEPIAPVVILDSVPRTRATSGRF